MKVYYLGFVSGFSRYSAIRVTTMIKMTLVMAEAREAPTWRRLETSIYCSTVAQAFWIAA